MANATNTNKSLKVTCPYCGNDGDAGIITLNLCDLREITCTSCDTNYSAEQAANKARENAERWAAVARWIDSAGTI